MLPKVKKIPRKGGPGITRADKPYVFTNMKKHIGLQQIIDFIVDKGMLDCE